MSEENQIVIPPSFIALFVPPGRIKPTASRAEISARHEFCEDLAASLTEHAGTRLWEAQFTQTEVLARICRALRHGDAVVSAAEAQWVVCRLAELLGWPMPGPACETGPAGGRHWKP
ncbi:MAG: ATPase with chaperone activity [Chitinophagaceae bacterium]|nr:ATPase with chaperone activity [Rubrivivax sp.]